MTRLNAAKVGLYVIIAIIHPIWAIDEYARIFRSWVWLSPPQPPIIIDRSPIDNMSVEFIDGAIWYAIEIGAIFCHVSMIRPDLSEIPWVTSGTHKWNGASPIFIESAIVNMSDEIWLYELDRVHWPKSMKLIIAPIIKIIDAVAWIRKYLHAASVDRGFPLLIRMGIIASILISRPIQVISQCELKSVIIVPENRVR